MKFIRNTLYLLGQGFVGVFRNSIMSTASILTLVCCMLVVGSFGLIIKSLDENFDMVKDINVIVAYISDKATDEDIASMKSQIEGYTSGVTVTFVSKEEGLEKLREDMGDDIYLNAYFNQDESGEEISEESGESHVIRENPLPDSFNISFESAVGAEALNNFVNKLTIKVVNTLSGNEEEIAGITETRHKIGLVEQAESAKNGMLAIAGILMGVLLVVALFVIMNTVKLGVFARRDEISVMRYVGATNSFIVTPFIVEGVIIGLVAAIIAVVLQFYLYNNIISDIASNYGIKNLVTFGECFAPVCGGFAGLGLFTGLIASSISTKKYLGV